MARYEVLTNTAGKSRKKYHVHDLVHSTEVFHTDRLSAAHRLILIAGEGDIDQHLQEGRDHTFVAIPGRLDHCRTCVDAKQRSAGLA